MSTTKQRYWKRRIIQHVVILLVTSAGTAIFWTLFPNRRDLISRLSIATAYPALFLTAAALLAGPWNVLRRRANPVSFDLRRDLGIWAGVIAVVHTAVGLNVHLRGRPWLYFIDQHRVRWDLFGFSNDTGAFAALLFVLLLSISNDLSLRKLGIARWKFLQRWTYLAAALTVLHAMAYQMVEKRQPAYQAALWVTTALICAFQIAGWRRRTQLAITPKVKVSAARL
jgi:methionine sulfoxide reductase heme-binding subunit